MMTLKCDSSKDLITFATIMGVQLNEWNFEKGIVTFNSRDGLGKLMFDLEENEPSGLAEQGKSGLKEVKEAVSKLATVVDCLLRSGLTSQLENECHDYLHEVERLLQ